MGLKYNYFLWKGDSETLKSKLLSAKSFEPKDNQLVLDAELEFTKKVDDLFKKLHHPHKNPEKADFDALRSIQKPQIILDYENRQKSVRFFSICFKQLLDTEYVYGGFSSNRLFPRKYEFLLARIFEESGISEFGIIDYHHNENRGHFKKINLLQKDMLYLKMGDIEKENNDYESYALRVQKFHHYPLLSLHTHLDNPCWNVDNVWDAEVEFRLPKPKFEDE